jgi:hypothetical protein
MCEMAQLISCQTLRRGIIPGILLDMNAHPHVRNPRQILQAAKSEKRRENNVLYFNDVVLEWITNHVLASVILFDIALIVPLLTITAPAEVKITLGVISGSWIQWWALPALQRSQNNTQAQNEAKAEVDHETLTYLVKLQDEQMIELKGITEILRNLERNICNNEAPGGLRRDEH